MKRLFYLFSILALTVALSSCSGNTKSAEGEDVAEENLSEEAARQKVVSNSYKYFLKKDFEKVAELYYIKEGATEKEIKEMKDNIAALCQLSLSQGIWAEHGSVKSWTFVEETVKGDKATLTYELVFEDGFTKKDKSKLQKEADGKWYLTIF